jgi:restriction system protein
MKKYYRLMLGRKSINAEECFAGNFVGADFGIAVDLNVNLPEEWREFNKTYIPIFLKSHPEKSKIAAGLACGALWTVAKGIMKDDILLCPDGSGRYHVCEVAGDYAYAPGGVLPHRRPVHWLPQSIDRAEMSEALKNSTGSIGTIGDISRHQVEIEKLIGTNSGPKIIITDDTVEDPLAFAMEKHLEDFLVENWQQTALGKMYDIYKEEGEPVGKQYPCDTGAIDILAISRDEKELLVVELKKGRASDVVVGQIQRYMGYVLQELAEEHQKVKGVIIALENDIKIRRALAVAPNIEFYRYKVSFKLFKA